MKPSGERMVTLVMDSFKPLVIALLILIAFLVFFDSLSSNGHSRNDSTFFRGRHETHYDYHSAHMDHVNSVAHGG